MRKGILIGLIVALIFIVFFTDFFIKKDFINKPIDLIRSFFTRIDIYQENLLLKQRVESLKAEIDKYQVSSIKYQVSNEEYLPAKVFSTYPFNVNNVLTLNVGKSRGIENGMNVTVGENILLGQIIEVFENKSIVQTIFDPQWQLSIRIGKDQIDGLLVGGIEPKIILFEKNMPLQVGDVVYSVGSDFLYGMKIGEIADIQRGNGDVFKEANLKIPYSINDLKEVYIRISNY